MNPQAAEKLGIKPFDAADYLQSDEDCAKYLQACIDEAPDDAALFSRALGDIARDTGITREGLYKALGEQGNPSLSTVLKVLHALGLRLNIDPQPKHT